MTARIRLAIVGCGDVVHRHYLPPLVAMAERVEIVGCSDARPAAAEGLAAAVRATSPNAVAFDRTELMLEAVRPEAVLNLTPAPFHEGVTRECLAGGAHVFSEKPLAATVAGATSLIADARQAGRLLMCAPASAVTRQVRWLAAMIATGDLGRPTLAVAQCAGMGPAGWREYTGDPTVFYGPGVGPVLDTGIYRLHEMTALLGPVRRVQAMGSIAIPERTIAGGPRAGQTMSVTSPDHVLIQMEFASGAMGQLVSSFAVPASRALRMEVFLSRGTVSLSGDPFADDEPVEVYAVEGAAWAGPAGTTPSANGWWHGLKAPPPEDPFPTVGMGVRHFVDCVAGLEEPVLTAEHARHVLEIVLLAYESMGDGRVRELETAY
jgi:predicted dehydrogenase